MNSTGAAAATHSGEAAAPRQSLCIRGEISAGDACHVHSHLVADHQADNTSVSLLLLHGSWNLLCPASSSSSSSPSSASAEPTSARSSSTGNPCEVISSILYAACGASPHLAIQTCPLSVASVSVDRDEASEDAAIDTLAAPPNLPALALVACGDVGADTASSSDGGSGGGVIRYVDINHTVLLALLRSSALSGETERHHEYDRVSMAVAHALGEISTELSAGGRLGSSLSSLASAQPMDTDAVLPRNDTGNGDDGPAVRIFIAGDRSQVGKSSVCLGLIGSLLKMGYPPSSLAYIKPATQCEATQLVATYCDKLGVANRPIGPVVYYKGFTRSFLAGETEGTDQLLSEAGRAVDDIAEGKRVVIVDGVGYPAVGSVCGTDNAAVAASCGVSDSSTASVARIPTPVLLVGKSGVGDAIDSFNLNATYFESNGVPVIGSVFNRLSLDGFYSLENCKKAVVSYFEQYQQDKRAFGFIPEVQGIANSRKETNESDAMDAGDERSEIEIAMDNAGQFVEAFAQYVDVAAIIASAKQVNETAGKSNGTSYSQKRGMYGESARTAKRAKLDIGKISSTVQDIKLTRMQIEQAAERAGAASG